MTALPASCRGRCRKVATKEPDPDFPRLLRCEKTQLFACTTVVDREKNSSYFRQCRCSRASSALCIVHPKPCARPAGDAGNCRAPHRPRQPMEASSTTKDLFLAAGQQAEESVLRLL